MNQKCRILYMLHVAEYIQGFLNEGILGMYKSIEKNLKENPNATFMDDIDAQVHTFISTHKVD